MICGANERFFLGANEIPIGAKAMRRNMHIQTIKQSMHTINLKAVSNLKIHP
jgi:hypothetical protein